MFVAVALTNCAQSVNGFALFAQECLYRIGIFFGNVETQEMYRTFNCGIGMVVIIAKEDADAVQTFLSEQGETVYRLGAVRERNGDEHQTQVA